MRKISYVIAGPATKGIQVDNIGSAVSSAGSIIDPSAICPLADPASRSRRQQRRFLAEKDFEEYRKYDPLGTVYNVVNWNISREDHKPKASCQTRGSMCEEFMNSMNRPLNHKKYKPCFPRSSCAFVLIHVLIDEFAVLARHVVLMNSNQGLGIQAIAPEALNKANLLPVISI